MKRERFAKLVEEALEALPEKFAKLVKNVAVVVEDEPSRDAAQRPAAEGKSALPTSAAHAGGVSGEVLVSFLAMAEGVKDDSVSVNVVSQTVVAPADAPLPLAGLQPCELLNLVLSAAVVRVLAEDEQKVVQRLDEGGIAFGGFVELPFE